MLRYGAPPLAHAFLLSPLIQKNKSGIAEAMPQFHAGELDSPFNLLGTEASGTCVHMARSTIDNGLDPLYIGLPGPIGTSVGVGNLNTKGNALATIITLRHSLHLLSEIVKFITPKQALRYDNRDC